MATKNFQPDYQSFMERADWLGIDPSLTNTGIAFRTHDEILSYRMTPPIGLREGSGRLAWFYAEFERIMQKRWKRVAVEGYSFGSKFSRSHRLGELGGLIRVTAYRAGHTVLELPPKSLCMYMSGKGNLPKKQHCSAVLKRWGIETQFDDEADAIALCSAAFAVTEKSFVHRYELDALAKAEYLIASPQQSAARSGVTSRARVRS